MGQLVTSTLEMWLGFILVFSLIEIIAGHGRLMEPPAKFNVEIWIWNTYQLQ